MSKTNQAELRRLMKEKQLTKQKKIDSPLAKYVDDQIVCIVCDSVVKSEILWPAHVNGRVHKQNVDARKNRNKTPQSKQESQSQPQEQPTVFKRPPTPPKSIKRKSEDPIQTSIEGKKIKEDCQAGIGIGVNKKQSLREFCSTLEENGNDDELPPSNTQLPADFFDNGMEVDNDEEPQEDKANSSSELPEGFFDNPVIDAKVRKVEYKDPSDVEWEKFQREIADVSNKSQAIIAEEEEESNVERQIEEVDDQINNWARVTALLRKKNELETKGTNVNVSGQLSDDSADEQEFEEFLDWRKKDSRR